MDYKVYKNFEEFYQDLRHPKVISHPVVEEKAKTPKKTSKKKKEND